MVFTKERLYTHIVIFGFYEHFVFKKFYRGATRIQTGHMRARETSLQCMVHQSDTEVRVSRVEHVVDEMHSVQM